MDKWMDRRQGHCRCKEIHVKLRQLLQSVNGFFPAAGTTHLSGGISRYLVVSFDKMRIDFIKYNSVRRAVRCFGDESLPSIAYNHALYKICGNTTLFSGFIATLISLKFH
jgi:hypothetical protein